MLDNSMPNINNLSVLVLSNNLYIERRMLHEIEDQVRNRSNLKHDEKQSLTSSWYERFLSVKYYLG